MWKHGPVICSLSDYVVHVSHCKTRTNNCFLNNVTLGQKNDFSGYLLVSTGNYILLEQDLGNIVVIDEINFF